MNFSSQNGVIWCILGHLRYSDVPLKGRNKTLVKILGVVNTGRPLQVKYWGWVANPATAAALTPMFTTVGWLGSRVVSVLDSGAERPGFKSQSRRRLRQTVHTHRASVYQAAKLVAALLRVAGVAVGLAESNGSLLPGL